MEGGQYNPRTVEEVFRDFKGRRAGLIKALTTDAEDFYQQCDPEKENLCLYGFPSEQWEVNLPAEEVPPELPEPAKRLFNMINDLPTIFEIVTGAVKKPQKEKPSATENSNGKSKSTSKVHRLYMKVYRSLNSCQDFYWRASESQAKYSKVSQPKEEEEMDEEDEDEDEHGEALCGACGENYANDEFWIYCDICERWFHGKCVKMTPARAEHIKQYKCPSCSNNKRARP
ncbi:hypothetical protein ACFE04_003831 [Oxalis oulophora]